MSYFPCAKCGQMVGVVGITIYSCGCKPDLSITPLDNPTLVKAAQSNGFPQNISEWAKLLASQTAELND